MMDLHADGTLSTSRERTNLYLHLCELLASFALQHSFRSHFYMLSSNIANHVGVGHHIEQKPLVEPRLGKTFFLDDPVANFNGSNDRLGERLGIFLLYQCLDVGAITDTQIRADSK